MKTSNQIKKILTIILTVTIMFPLISLDGSSSEVEGPSMQFSFLDQSNTFYIVSIDPGYQYSTTSSDDGRQLVFLKNGITYYVLNDMSIGFNGTLSTQTILAGDYITGFTPGVYTVHWYPTSQNLGSFVVPTGENSPEIYFYYDTGLHFVYITQTTPGLQYSSGTSVSDANVIFLRDDGTVWYIAHDFSATMSESATLSTSEIQIGDILTNFPSGTYSMIWKPTWSVIGLFNVYEQEFTFKILSPQGGANCSGTVNVEWTDLYDFPDNPDVILFTLEYKTATGTIWNKIVDTFSTSYSWDTTKIPNGVYSLRVSCIINGVGFMASIDGDITVSNQENELEQAQLYGLVDGIPISEVQEQTNSTLENRSVLPIYSVSTQGTPIAYATVGLMSVNDPNMTNGYWMQTFTDQNGRYLFNNLAQGWYHLRASAEGFDSMMMTMFITVDELQEQNFHLRPSLNPSTPSHYTGNRTLIIRAVQDGHVGGSLAVWKNTSTAAYQHEISVYNKDILLSTVEISKDSISFVVSSEEHSGKTIVIDADATVLNPNGNIFITYDGVPINMADDVADVLDPTNDASAEYLFTVGANGVQLLISIPHFSQHSITISSVIEIIGGIYAFILYISVFLLLGIFYITSFFFVRGRKRK